MPPISNSTPATAPAFMKPRPGAAPLPPGAKTPIRPIAVKPGTRAAPRQSAVLRIKDLSFEPQEGIQLIVYGRSGTGKTTFWSSFPKPIMAMIASGGENPGELRSIDTPENRRDIKCVRLDHPHDMLDIVEHVKATQAPDGRPWGTVVLDHVSGLQDITLAKILGLTQLPAQKHWGMATQPQYGQCVGQCKEVLRALLSLNCNVVIVGQEREFKSDIGEESGIDPTIGIAVTPSLAGWLNPAVDYITRTFIKQREEDRVTTVGKGAQSKQIVQRVKLKGQMDYCLMTAPSDVYQTKFRVPKGTPIPQYLVDPDHAQVMSLIQGTYWDGRQAEEPVEYADALTEETPEPAEGETPAE